MLTALLCSFTSGFCSLPGMYHCCGWAKSHSLLAKFFFQPAFQAVNWLVSVPSSSLQQTGHLWLVGLTGPAFPCHASNVVKSIHTRHVTVIPDRHLNILKCCKENPLCYGQSSNYLCGILLYLPTPLEQHSQTVWWPTCCSPVSSPPST